MNNLKKIKITPQFIIGFFLVVLIITAKGIGMNMTILLNESFVKFAMNGIFVLSLLPMLNAGMGMNFGLPVSICGGLVGMCVVVNYNIIGMTALLLSIIIGSLIAIILGSIYAFIILKVRGREEITGTFIGFAFIPLMNFFWTLIPFSNRQMVYPIGGSGLRPRIGLNTYFSSVLDRSFLVTFGDFEFPLGLLSVYLFIGASLYFFYKTSIGKAMLAVGENPSFIKGSGLNVNKLKLISICISFAIGAIGICVYAQSFGFIELYDAPLNFVFPTVSALLIGGATAKHGTVRQANIGTYLFQSMFLLSVPIANILLLPEVSEIMRSIVTNGIILYALLMNHQRRSYETSI